MAWQTSSQVWNRRPLRASERRTFHQGSIRLRYAAYVGWKTNSHRGWASETSRTAVARWAERLSTIPYTRSSSAGSQASTRVRESAQLAALRLGEGAVNASPSRGL